MAVDAIAPTPLPIEQLLMRWENVPAPFLGQGGINVQHEWIGVRVARLRHDKGHIVRHQAGDEMDVTAQPIELGDDDRRLVFARGLERRGQLPPAIGRV